MMNRPKLEKEAQGTDWSHVNDSLWYILDRNSLAANFGLAIEALLLTLPLKHATPQLLLGQCLATESTEAATAFGCIPLIMERSDVKAFF